MKTEIILERQENFVVKPIRRDREQECKTIMIFALRSRTQKSCLNDEKSTTKEYYWDSESLSLSHLLPDTKFFVHRVFYASFITLKMCYLLCLNNSLGRSRTNHALFNVEISQPYFSERWRKIFSLSFGSGENFMSFKSQKRHCHNAHKQKKERKFTLKSSLYSLNFISFWKGWKMQKTAD